MTYPLNRRFGSHSVTPDPPEINIKQLLPPKLLKPCQQHVIPPPLLKPLLPRRVRLAQPTVVSQVLTKRQLAVDVNVRAATRVRNREVGVLVHEALGAGLEGFNCRFSPPLCGGEGIYKYDDGDRVKEE